MADTTSDLSFADRRCKGQIIADFRSPTLDSTFLTWLLLPFIGAVIIPSARMLLAYTLVGLALFGYMFLQSTEDGSAGWVFGTALVGLAFAGFASGVLARAIGLLFARFGVGFVLAQTPVLLIGGGLLALYYFVSHVWLRRPLP